MSESIKTVTLNDNRQLAYAEYGNAGGTPVFYCHGCGTGSRLFARGLDSAAAGIRLIAIDRPGIGHSTPKPDRTILEWPDDLMQLADQLGIEQFGLLSESAGSAYALAAAYRYPGRVTAASLVSAICPLFDLEDMEDIPLRGRMMIGMYKNVPPWVTGLMFSALGKALTGNPQKVFEKMARQLLTSERDIVFSPLYRQFFTSSVLTALTQGVEHVALDVKLCFSDWGFDLRKIKVPVDIWHGREDLTAPVKMAQLMAEAIPGSTPFFLAGEGHVSVINLYGKKILERLGVSREKEVSSSGTI